VEVSVNATVWAVTGATGAKANAAVGVDVDVTVLVQPLPTAARKARASIAIREIDEEALFMCVLLSLVVVGKSRRVLETRVSRISVRRETEKGKGQKARGKTPVLIGSVRLQVVERDFAGLSDLQLEYVSSKIQASFMSPVGDSDISGIAYQYYAYRDGAIG
jgi:hypothetical protein